MTTITTLETMDNAPPASILAPPPPALAYQMADNGFCRVIYRTKPSAQHGKARYMVLQIENYRAKTFQLFTASAWSGEVEPEAPVADVTRWRFPRFPAPELEAETICREAADWIEANGLWEAAP